MIDDRHVIVQQKKQQLVAAADHADPLNCGRAAAAMRRRVEIHLTCIRPLFHSGTVETTLQKSPPATILTAPLWSCRKALHNPLSYFFPLAIPVSGLLPSIRPL